MQWKQEWELERKWEWDGDGNGNRNKYGDGYRNGQVMGIGWQWEIERK